MLTTQVQADSSPIAAQKVISQKSADKVAKELSQISASFVYNLDRVQLKQTLMVIFNNNQQLKAVTITDFATSQILFSYYRDDSNGLSEGDIPDSFSNFTSASASIVYKGNMLGTVEIRFEPETEDNAIDTLTPNIGALAALFAVFAVVLVIILRLISQGAGDYNRNLIFGTKRFARLIIIALSIFVTLVIASSWIMLKFNRHAIEERLEDSFHQYLISLNSTLSNASNIRTATFQHIFAKPAFQKNYLAIEQALEDGDGEKADFYRKTLSELWDLYRKFGNGLSKLILKPDLEVVFSQNSTLEPHSVSREPESSFIRALSGESSIMSIPTNSMTHEHFYQRYFATPVYNESTGQVMAVAIIEIEDIENTYRNLLNHQFSESGEIMAFDIEGNLLSSSRFLGSSGKSQSHIRQMLDDAKANGFDNSTHPLYSIVDYRGKQVYAMLHWSKNLNVAFLVKMDAEEVLEDYYRFRNGMLVIIIAMIAFTVPSMLFTLYAGNHSNRSLKASRREIINRLGHAAEFKDNETAMHIVRMSHYTEVLARNFNLSATRVELISSAAPMHDIGKIGVPDAILQKPGKLNAEEWQVMKKHPRFGADIIGEHYDSDLLNMAKQIALYHHEKWDGSGYPIGLSGEHIPLSARIVAIADVFDALTSERPYKKAWSFDDATQLILSESGKHFDPRLVKVFRESLAEFKMIMHKYKDSSE